MTEIIFPDIPTISKIYIYLSKGYESMLYEYLKENYEPGEPIFFGDIDITFAEHIGESRRKKLKN